MNTLLNGIEVPGAFSSNSSRAVMILCTGRLREEVDDRGIDLERVGAELGSEERVLEAVRALADRAGFGVFVERTEGWRDGTVSSCAS